MSNNLNIIKLNLIKIYASIKYFVSKYKICKWMKVYYLIYLFTYLSSLTKVGSKSS
jgi:hypothetical protein